MLSFLPHDRQDIPLRIKWINNESASKYAIDSSEKPTDLKKQKAWFDRYEKNLRKKFFTIYEGDRPIGFMGLTVTEENKKEAEIFILIGEDDCRGRGLGKIAVRHLIDYAFKELGLNSLILGVNKLNIPAINLYKSLNFSKTRESENEIKMILNNPYSY